MTPTAGSESAAHAAAISCCVAGGSVCHIWLSRSRCRSALARGGRPGEGWICGVRPCDCSPGSIDDAEFGLARHRRFVLLLGHADRSGAPSGEELVDDRLLGREQHLARPEGDERAAEQHADVVRQRPGECDVVGDDQDRRIQLGVDVDEQLRQIGSTYRIEPAVRFVAQDDLRVEHERTGQAGALAHAAGDLAGQLVLLAREPDHLHLLEHDPADLGLGLLRVLAQREGDVVEQRQRAEQGAVLEQHAEQPADPQHVLLRRRHDVLAVDHAGAALGAQQADHAFQEDRLAGAGRAEQGADLAGGQGERDVVPDVLPAEGLGQVRHPDFDAHADPPPLHRQDSTRRPPECTTGANAWRDCIGVASES